MSFFILFFLFLVFTGFRFGKGRPVVAPYRLPRETSPRS